MKQVCCSIAGSLALLLLADCSGSAGMDVPDLVFTTPSSATELSSDRPETFGGPPPEQSLPATIPTPGRSQR